jgi:hypothetical protein
VVYYKNDTAKQSSPPEGAVSFALRTTDITLDKAAPKKADSGNPNAGDKPDKPLDPRRPPKFPHLWPGQTPPPER